MTLDSSRSLLIRLLTLAALVLLPPVAILSASALNDFERGMAPELDKKAMAVGRDITGQIERAVGYGIPLHSLVGMDDFFRPVLASNPEIRYLAVSDTAGKVLFVTGIDRTVVEPEYRSAGLAIGDGGHRAAIAGYVDLALPLTPKGQAVGLVHVGFDQNYIRGRLNDIVADIFVVMVVSLIVAFEILLFVVFFNITGQLKLVSRVMDQVRRGDFTSVPKVVSADEVGRFVRALQAAVRQVDDLYRRLAAYIDEVKAAHFDRTVVERVGDIESRVKFLFRFSPAGLPRTTHEAQATDIRLPLFLFVFAEEVSRSFMPLYTKELLRSASGSWPEALIALPIAVFMAGIALATPYGGRLTERLGARRVFLLGMIPALAGYVMTSLAVTVFDLMLWRALTGVGYALVTMACQGYIGKVLSQGNRTQNLGMFIGAVLTASVCGTGIGGVLAERVGYRATFIISAALTLMSGWLISRLLSDGAEERHHGREVAGRELWGLFRNWRFAVLIAFAAVPSKMALTGFLFFLAPLTLFQAGNDLGDIARTLMIYPVAVVLLSPLAAYLSDRHGLRAGLVAVGGLIGGLGLVLPVLLPASWGVFFGILALGIAHGLSASPQLAMVPDICWIECRRLGQTNVLAFVRVVERIGSVVGPLIAAALVSGWGYGVAAVGLGVAVLALACVFAAASRHYGDGPHIEAEETA
ncbi:MAG: MFS transporter [Solirubrobacterales bacterium]